MGCDCGSVGKSDLWTSIPQSALTEMQLGEDVECYGKRAPEDTDKAGQPEIVDKIRNNAVVPDCEMKIDVQFELTPGSPSSKFTGPVVWSMVDPDDQTGSRGAYTISGLTFTSSGKLSGTMDPQSEGKKFNIMIIAKDSSNPPKIIDSRSYNFSPKKCTPGADLKFIHPLPGARTTSKFGPRTPPANGASSFHKGVDFAYPGGVTKDVLASCDGKVTKAGVGSGYGNVVYIQHVNGSGKPMAETRYAHLASIYVSVGQQVSAGQPVGKEGNTGIGTGCHLHFELRLPGDVAVDPLEYINGTITSSNSGTTTNSDGATVPDPGNPTGQASQHENVNKAVTTAKVDAIAAGCTQPLPAQSVISPAKEPANDKPALASSRAPCKPESGQSPPVSEVKQRMRAVMDKHPELDENDKNYLMAIAKIESSYDPYAKNKTSSATGLFQMLDSTANAYYKKIGLEATCENRCDIEKATEAEILFYKEGSLKYYNEFKNKRTLERKKLSPDLIAKYDALTKAEFCYGLIHHDGVGNAANGVDKQGVAIAKAKLGGSGLA